MNTQRLLDLIQINEECEKFNLSTWTCGTYGCLVGNYNLERKILEKYTYKSIAEHFDIPFSISYFLFAPSNFARENNLMRDPYYNTSINKTRNSFDKASAIRRVRKYIYYKLHQQEMMYDEKGCIKESARKAGNWDLLKKVKCAVSL